MTDSLKEKSHKRLAEIRKTISRFEHVGREDKHELEKRLLREFRNALGEGIPDDVPAWEANAVFRLAATLNYLDDLHKDTLDSNASEPDQEAFASLQRSYMEVMMHFGGAYGLRETAAELIRRDAALKSKRKAAMNLAYWGDEQHLGTTSSTNDAAAEFFGYEGRGGVLPFIHDVLEIEDGRAWQRALQKPATVKDVARAAADYTPPADRSPPELRGDEDAGEVEHGDQAEPPQPENLAERLPQRLDGQQLRGRENDPEQERS